MRNIVILAVIAWSALVSGPARAEEISFIRDAEIENTIRAYATPLFEQAGVDPAAVHIYLVKDNQLNAFVAEGLNLFLNTGLIVRTEHPGQLIGVIAHESGHIAGGHLVRGTNAYNTAISQSLATMLLGAAAAIATGRGDLGAAVMVGGAQTAERNYLAFSRGIEASADTAALTFLDNLHMSARGFLEFMQTIEGEELLVSARQDPYVRTHPLTTDRIEEIRHHVDTSPYSNVPPPPQFVEPHRRMRAKLIAFMESPAVALNRYREGDPSIEARYARSIAYYRQPNLERAIPLIDGLIAERPNDPYFHELKGQMLFENGHAVEAVPEYRAAVAHLPDNALLREELGQVEIETDDPALIADAKTNLKFATSREPDNAGTWRLLGIAYGKSGDEVMAEASLAEYALLAERWSEALYHTGKVLKVVKPGSPVGLRMEDIRSQAELGQRKSRR